MNDMGRVIIPDSSQINADELQAGPLTIKIAGVKIKGGKEQPVDISIEGMEKVYRPCKSMCRCLVAAWGPDSSKYVGRSLTLYCDPSVKWGGLAVGGLRISHMSDIADDMTMALTVTRANKKPFTVRPIRTKESAPPLSASTDSLPSSDGQATVADQYITPDQCATLETLCHDNGIKLSTLKDKAEVERLAQMRADKYDDAMAWINVVIAAKQKAKAAKEVA